MWWRGVPKWKRRMVGSRCDNITDQRQLIADTHWTLTVKGGGEGQRDTVSGREIWVK